MKKILSIAFSLLVCLFLVPCNTYAEGEQEGQAVENVTEAPTIDQNRQDIDQNRQDIEALQEQINNMDTKKAIEEYFDSIQEPEEVEEPEEPTEKKSYKISSGSTRKKILAPPSAMALLSEYLLGAAKDMIAWGDPSMNTYNDAFDDGHETTNLKFGINISNIDKPDTPLGKLVNPIRIFAYSLVLLFFSITLVEQTMKYEIFTLKGILQVFGRILLAKIIIDISVKICMLILRIVGGLASQMLDNVDVTFSIYPDVSIEKSEVKVIGPVIDAIVAFVLSFFLSIIMLVVLVCVAIVMIKLVLRSIELAMLMVVSPAFFACLSSDVTKAYFKRFITVFIQVASQTLFMAIALAVCSTDMAAQNGTEIDSIKGLAISLIKIAPNALTVIAMCVMMVKPPKVLTNLVG